MKPDEDSDTVPTRAATAASLWRALVDAAPSGQDAPEDDRARVERAAGEGAAAYGELPPDSAARLLRWLAPTAADVLYDLGSGTGKLVIQAACTTAVARAVGVELSGYRHDVAQRTRAALLEALPAAEAAALAPRIELRREDLRETDLAAATIVYAGSTCYPDPLLGALAARVAEEAPRLRALISARSLPLAGARGLEELGRVRLAQSWSACERVVVYGPRRERTPR